MDKPLLTGYYEPHRVEDYVLKFWEINKIYESIKTRNRSGPRLFNFIDGPPYPSGDVPHIGTAWNKSLKDSILRYKRMKGYRVNDTPGYDCHGLPIEVKVEQKLNIKYKREIEEKIGVDKFIEECKRFAMNNLNAMTRWFKELGVFMDWDNPYLTLTNEYIEAAWWLIKQADRQGLLESELRVVYWCPRCSTTLAEYEVEYKELEDPSIYVKLPVNEEEKTYLVIWTTTPWTLPANVFVMVHPDEYYVKVRVGDEYWILAEKRLENVMRECNISSYDIVSRVKGVELARYTYRHPLESIIPLQRTLRSYHRVILSREHVTMFEGTGLVHGAPGHGFEDFEVAVSNDLHETIVSPVDDEGKFTEEAGLFAGLGVRDANKEIISKLRETGSLAGEGRIVHRYPVCWRCKTPVILRSTRQWIIKVSRLKDKLVDEASNVNWIPSWALTRLLNMLENIQDWVISRQRYWGTPLPIWLCPRGHRVVIGSVDELLKYAGYVPQDLHKPWIDQVVFKCPVCGEEMRRVPDVVDVWLDSGVSFYASIGHPEKDIRGDVVVDFIVEGHDQIRGWFFSLLRSGVIGFGKAPYRNVLVHGFMLDEQGREMHKSLGNYVGTDEAIERVGRDPLRLWLLSNTIWEDIKFSWREIEEAKRDLSILWNIAVFAKTYMELDNFNPLDHPLDKYYAQLKIEDRWIISKINTLIKRVEDAFETYNIFEGVRAIREFIVEDLSRWYIRLIRPRVWIEENAVDKLTAYTTLYYVLDRLVRLLAPIVPFISEYIYQSLLRDTKGVESVHMLEWPTVDPSLIDSDLEKKMEIIRELHSVAASARMKAGLKLRQPVKRLIVYTDHADVIKAVDTLKDVLKFACNTRQVEVLEHKKIMDITRYSVEPVYKSIGPKYRSLAKRVLQYIEENQDRVAHDIITNGYHEASIEGALVRLTREDVIITPRYIKGYIVEETTYGAIALDAELSIEEIADGLAREIVRRLQVMRRRLNLPLTARIKTLVIAPADKIELIESRRSYIMSETRSLELTVTSDTTKKGLLNGFVEEWEIEDEDYIIEVAVVE